MDKKVLVLDIDGTLTNSQKEITPATKRSIQEILAKGHKVILASGRPTTGLKKFEKELELEKYDGYLLSFNGARAIECRTGEVVYQRTLPEYIIPKIYHFAKEYGCGLVTYLGDQIISAFEPNEYVMKESRACNMPVKVVENFAEYVDFEVNKCLLSIDPQIAPRYTEILTGKFGDIVSVYQSEVYYIEIMPKNVDKATTLDKMLQVLGAKREDTICCGDSFNDISMVSYAGIGVAMANAQEKLKEVADFITDSNDDDGIVRVIETFIK